MQGKLASRVFLGGMACVMAIGIVALGFAGARAAAPKIVYVGGPLFGDKVPGGGDKRAGGNLMMELNLTSGELCYLLEVDQLPDAGAAHVHEGKRGESGPSVMTLTIAAPEDDLICLRPDPSFLANLAKSPDRYYVDVHSQAFPDGAIRAQMDD